MLQLTERLEEHRAADDSICLPFDDRKRGRLKAITLSGKTAGIFLERGEVMRHGTLLKAETGEVVEVLAADEQVSTVVCQNPHLFARACYHLGNRHVPLQIGATDNGASQWLRYQCDHVLDEMLELLGLEVVQGSAPFEPENGAYARSGHSHSHSHGHHHHDHHEH
ncbi:urease accessory protein UreE [Parendozoicomonas haliclonae]|uniref:Urease accessory protein UreE n=1 Tax=Parendozoicomonas haliclonae TaxID=1960125 RepID=A0A1X7AGZ7_9GAMM|nr:urease accessory protein UreE [Parendozoicomonas haliclonae]SMA41655.1 Urease accessory protein UreE [Parendozoicomonas haliclonae]